MADLKILKEQQEALLACEALGFLHNIGKLDDRFSRQEYLYKRVADPASLKLNSQHTDDINSIVDTSGEKPKPTEDEIILLACTLGVTEEQVATCIAEKKVEDEKEGSKKIPLLLYLAYSEEKLRPLLSGAHLIHLLRSQGVDLSETEISNFISAYLQWRGGTPSSPLPSELPVLQEKYPYALLLNLFWDDLHWRIQKPYNKRLDNLSFWLEGHQDGFDRFRRVMAICREAISRGDKGSGIYGQPVRNRTNILGSGEAEQKRLKNSEIKYLTKMF